MDVSIRLATDRDVPTITQIYNQAIALKSATADIEPVTEAQSKHAWLAGHSPDKYPVFVAEQRGRLVGYASLSPYRSGRMALRHTAEISYYVHEDFRSMGFGSMLIEHAIAECPRLDLKTLFAILLDINPASVRLLEKFGFRQWGHLPDVAEFDGVECGHLYFGRRVES